jgi:hypothetical protein
MPTRARATTNGIMIIGFIVSHLVLSSSMFRVKMKIKPIANFGPLKDKPLGLS